MSDMKCPICGETLQKYGEVDPDAGTCIVLGANCPKCGIGDSDIKLWQEFIRTQELLDIESAEHSMCHTQMLKTTEKLERTRKALEQTTDALEKEIKSGKEFAEYMRTRLGRAKKQLKDADIALEIIERDFGGTFSTDYRTLLRTIRDARERIQKELNNEE